MAKAQELPVMVAMAARLVNHVGSLARRVSKQAELGCKSSESKQTSNNCCRKLFTFTANDSGLRRCSALSRRASKTSFSLTLAGCPLRNIANEHANNGHSRQQEVAKLLTQKVRVLVVVVVCRV